VSGLATEMDLDRYFLARNPKKGLRGREASLTGMKSGVQRAYSEAMRVTNTATTISASYTPNTSFLTRVDRLSVLQMSNGPLKCGPVSRT
jgi:hypothetical protein